MTQGLKQERKMSMVLSKGRHLTRLQLEVDPTVNLYPIEWKNLVFFESFKDLKALSLAAMLSVMAILGIWRLVPAFNGNMAMLAIGVHFAVAAVLTKLSARG